MNAVAHPHIMSEVVNLLKDIVVHVHDHKIGTDWTIELTDAQTVVIGPPNAVIRTLYLKSDGDQYDGTTNAATGNVGTFRKFCAKKTNHAPIRPTLENGEYTLFVTYTL